MGCPGEDHRNNVFFIGCREDGQPDGDGGGRGGGEVPRVPGDGDDDGWGGGQVPRVPGDGDDGGGVVPNWLGDGGGDGEGRKGGEARNKGRERGKIHFEYLMTFQRGLCGCVVVYDALVYCMEEVGRLEVKAQKPWGDRPLIPPTLLASLWLIGEFATARPAFEMVRYACGRPSSMHYAAKILKPLVTKSHVHQPMVQKFVDACRIVSRKYLASALAYLPTYARCSRRSQTFFCAM